MPSNSGCGSPASLPPVVGEGPVCRRLAFLWCSLNPLFYERARLHIRLEPFAGKFSLSLSFFLSGYPTIWVAVSCKFPQVVFRTFRPGPYPKHAAHASLSSPHLLVAEASIWATSLLAVVVRCIFCGVLFFLFLLVMLPSEIPKLSTDLTMRGFPAVWKLLLHDSLPRMGLCHP